MAKKKKKRGKKTQILDSCTLIHTCIRPPGWGDESVKMSKRGND